MTLAHVNYDNTYKEFIAGTDDCLLSPVHYCELVFRIRVLINRPSHSFFGYSMIEAGDIMLNLESKEVMRGSKLIMITSQEFLALRYLLQHQNRIVTRTELVCCIWGNDSYPNQMRLAGCMNSLRKKIEYAPLPKCIYTVSRKGYLLV